MSRVVFLSKIHSHVFLEPETGPQALPTSSSSSSSSLLLSSSSLLLLLLLLLLTHFQCTKALLFLNRSL